MKKATRDYHKRLREANQFFKIALKSITGTFYNNDEMKQRVAAAVQIYFNLKKKPNMKVKIGDKEMSPIDFYKELGKGIVKEGLDVVG
jgi:hypothetical protein